MAGPRTRLLVVLGAAALALAGCQFPRDPEGALNRVEGGAMRVGIAVNEPWVRFEDDRAGGVEVKLIEDFARGLDARIDYTEGIVGIGFGLWWADAVAATLISLDIVHDGWKNLKLGVFDLMDSRPKTYDGSGKHPLPERVQAHLRGLDWVKDASLRLREEGHVLSGQALVIPQTDENLSKNVGKRMAELEELDWQLRDVVVAPVSELEEPGQAAEQEREEP